VNGPERQRILIVRGAFGDLWEPAWERALRELGSESEIFDSHALTLPGVFGRIERRVMAGPGVERANREILQRVRRDRPDVTLLYQGHYFRSETLRELQRYTFVTGYHDDDPFGTKSMLFRYRNLIPALPHYQGFHVIRRLNLQDFRRRGVRNVRVLMHAYRPWLHYPAVLTTEEYHRYGADLAFVGHAERDLRVTCLSEAAQRGIRVRVFGGEREWRKVLSRRVMSLVGPSPRLSPEDYRKAVCGCKIAAAFYSKWNRDDYGMRSFEIPACGAFLLSERTETMQTLFDEGREAEFFSSSEEFVDKIQYYLKHETLRSKIAAAGRRRVVASGHDLHSRMLQWLKDVAAWRRGETPQT
jgi:hypothetical protein